MLMGLAATAQTRPCDADFAASDACLGAGNAVWLTQLDTARLSQASFFADYRKGGLRNYSDADKQTTLGAQTDTYARLPMQRGEAFVYGAAGYDYSSGKHMNGSVFIDPEWMPFDLVMTDSTAGTKHLENYAIEGAAAWTDGRLTFGARLALNAASYAKTRDLRHNNKLLALDLTAGFGYDFGPIAIAANYAYSRSTEGIDFGIYGTQDKTYTTLVSYGTFWGLPETASTSLGFTQTTREMPFFDSHNGGAVQLLARFGERWRWFADFSLSHRSGYYGPESAYTAVLTDHEGNRFDVTSQLTFELSTVRQRLTAHFVHETLENSLRLYRTESDGYGLTEVVYYGTTPTLDADRTQLAVDYRADLGVDCGTPRWTFALDYSLNSTDRTAMRFLITHRTQIDTHRLAASVVRNVFVGESLISAKLGGAVQWGSGTPSEFGTQQGTQPTSTRLTLLTDDLMTDYDFRTNRRGLGSAEVGFMHPVASVSLGFKLSYAFEKCAHSDFLDGSTRHHFAASLACQF